MTFQHDHTRELLTTSIFWDYLFVHCCTPAHPISAAAKVSCFFYARSHLTWKRRWGSAVQGDFFQYPRDNCAEANTPLVFAGARLRLMEEPKRQHTPSTYSKQTSETLSLPGETIKETKKRQGGMQTAWFQFRKNPMHFQSRRR